MNVCQFLSQPLTSLISFLFLPLHLIDSHPASDDTAVLSVVSPPAAATAREQHYSSELNSATGTDWSSAVTGDTHTPALLTLNMLIYLTHV